MKCVTPLLALLALTCGLGAGCSSDEAAAPPSAAARPVKPSPAPAGFRNAEAGLLRLIVPAGLRTDWPHTDHTIFTAYARARDNRVPRVSASAQDTPESLGNVVNDLMSVNTIGGRHFRATSDEPVTVRGSDEAERVVIRYSLEHKGTPVPITHSMIAARKGGRIWLVSVIVPDAERRTFAAKPILDAVQLTGGPGVPAGYRAVELDAARFAIPRDLPVDDRFVNVDTVFSAVKPGPRSSQPRVFLDVYSSRRSLASEVRSAGDADGVTLASDDAAEVPGSDEARRLVATADGRTVTIVLARRGTRYFRLAIVVPDATHDKLDAAAVAGSFELNCDRLAEAGSDRRC